MRKVPLGRLTHLLSIYRGWSIVGVSFFALFTNGSATSYLFGVLVLPMEEDLGWSRTTLVGALTVGTLVTAAVGVLIGPWFDRHGVRLGMTASALIGGVCLVLTGLIKEPWQYYLLFGVGMGITRAGLENIGPRTVISNWFIRRRAAAFAWFTGGRAVFGFTMVPVFTWIAIAFSWRAGWIVLGVVQLIVLVPALWVIVRRRPEDYGLLPDGDPPGSSSGNRSFRSQTVASDLDPWTRKEALHSKTFWLLVAGFVMTGFPATGVIANMVPYFHDSGLSASAAAAGFSLFGLGAIFGRPVWGYVVSRFGVYPSMVAYGISYGAVILAFVAAFNGITLLLTALPIGVVTGGAQQLQAQAWPDYYGRRHVGSITGVSILATTPALAAGPLVAALAFDLLGSYTVVLTAYGAAALSAGFLFWLARPPRR